MLRHDSPMAKEKVYSEVLNLRIDEAMSLEIKRIAGVTGQPDSETARMLIDWGIEAHRAKEAALLRQRYDAGPAVDRYGIPLELRIVAEWAQVPDWDAENG